MVPKPRPCRRLFAAVLALGLSACSASSGQASGESRGADAEDGGKQKAHDGARPTAETAPGGQIADGEPSQPAEVATVGWDGLSDAPLVLLREVASGRVVPIWVGPAEAQAIAVALHGVEFPRPMTHDLMRDLLAGLGARVTALDIHDLRDGTYYGRLRLEVEGRAEPLLVDTRPSDGIALALRTGAEILVSRKVLDETPDFHFLAPEAGDQVVSAFGLTLVAPTEGLRRELSLPDRPGLVVRSAAGEAARVGLRRGDFVIEVNGVVPETPMVFLDIVRAAPASAPVAVTYWRDGEETSVELLPDPIPERRDPGRSRIA